MNKICVQNKKKLQNIVRAKFFKPFFLLLRLRKIPRNHLFFPRKLIYNFRMFENEVSVFLKKHNFDENLSVGFLTEKILDDMNHDLLFGSEKAGGDMFRTWILPPDAKPKNKSVIVIDAGGTNFRSCLVSFDEKGAFSISDFKKTKMPGVEKELSRREFFDAVADNLEYLKNKSDRIGFCFSYSMEITKDGDGIATAFSKEVKIPEVIGCKIGETLVETLRSRGWNKIKKIILLNDTEAALLAGKAAAKNGTEFSSYIGFIFGTGINGAYIQPEIEKTEKYDGIKKQIIVCENGKCDKIPLSDFDKSMDEKSFFPGQYLLEKQCSGAYLGPVALEMLRFAADEKFLSDKCSRKIRNLKNLTLIEADDFLHSPFKAGTVGDLCGNDDDREKIYLLFDALISRAAKNGAAILSACALQSGEGKNPLHPVGMLCNGTTFYKTHKLFGRIFSYLENFLTKERGIYFEILTLENDITLGTAIAGLIGN